MRISNNHEIIIKVPEHIPKNEPVEVILLLKDESDNSIHILKQFNSDPDIKDWNSKNNDVIVISKSDSEAYKQKINKMREAVLDKLFLKDIAEVSEDFKYADLDGWEE